MLLFILPEIYYLEKNSWRKEENLSEFSHKRKTLRIKEEELRINEKELYYRILSIDRGDSRRELEGETYWRRWILGTSRKTHTQRERERNDCSSFNY
jgi:hypothetical protein